MAGAIEPNRVKLVLGVDPGLHDTGWSLYQRGKGLRYSGVIDGLDHVDLFSLTQCHKRFATLLRVYKPDAVAIERYHAQPRGRKATMETQNLQIGILIEQCIRKKIPWHLVTPSTHKRWLSSNYVVGVVAGKQRRGRGIKKTYDIRTYKEWCRLSTEHEADASNVAKYCVEKIYGPVPAAKRRKTK